ncbi:esterase-like activity of phytase family protein [Plantactinospora solaniradicis]|uniref:Esterase-like activity of phytase family protein n=1 Tax=Plantactinospora solaniradicis TaxID=1723736 RepID=A0ABW1K9D5_9ACTN
MQVPRATGRFVRTAMVAGLITVPALFGQASFAAAPSANDAGFARLATVPVYLNSAEDQETVAEISAVSTDGKTVISTDSPGKRLGFIDISDPANPKPTGTYALPGEPTSVAVYKNYVLAVVNTSADFVNTSGVLVVLDLDTRKEVRMPMALGGQPDSIAIAPSGRYAAIAIENERDEDLNDGKLPQKPAGFLQVVDLGKKPQNWTLDRVEFKGLTMVAPGDPEPEYVSINGRDEAVVTLQENNHIAIVDLKSKKVVRSIGAGQVRLSGVDTEDDGTIAQDKSITVRREPDGVVWIDNNTFATANEGDYVGGSRGFTVWKRTGEILYDAGNSFDRLAAAHGLYPESRSDAKGTEPEGVAYGKFNGKPVLFVNSERGNFVAAYDISRPKAPEFLQMLPTTNGPEGITTVPSRDLLVVSSEEDLLDDGIRASVTIFQYGKQKGAFPTIRSAYEPGQKKAPISWGALSGLSAVPGQPDQVVSITDNVYTPTRLLTIDTAQEPALVKSELTVIKGGQPVGYDAEGLAARATGGYWIAVEGDGTAAKPNLIVRLDARGAVQEEIPLPTDVATNVTSNGLEGVALTGVGDSEQVWVAVQRELKGDPKGTVRIGRYSVADKKWTWLAYQLDAAPAGAWIGLSELVPVDGDTFAVIERDNQRGPKAAVKKVYSFDVPADFGTASLPTAKKTLAVDLLPLLKTDNGWVQDKVEGLTIAGNGQVYAVTDNDGVEDATGETVFMRLGPAKKVFTPGATGGAGGGTGDGGSLPLTGAPALLIAGTGAAVIAAGAVLFLRARRAKLRFTA